MFRGYFSYKEQVDKYTDTSATILEPVNQTL